MKAIVFPGGDSSARQLLRWCFRHKLISGLHVAELGTPSRAVEWKPKGRPRDAVATEQNARWNRIFEEKFADPSYYSNPPQTRMLQSPLARILK